MRVYLFSYETLIMDSPNQSPFQLQGRSVGAAVETRGPYLDIMCSQFLHELFTSSLLLMFSSYDSHVFQVLTNWIEHIGFHFPCSPHVFAQVYWHTCAMVLFSITREFPQLDPRVTCGKQQCKATGIGTRCYTPMFNGGFRRDLGLTTWSSAGGATQKTRKGQQD